MRAPSNKPLPKEVFLVRGGKVTVIGDVMLRASKPGGAVAKALGDGSYHRHMNELERRGYIIKHKAVSGKRWIATFKGAKEIVTIMMAQSAGAPLPTVSISLTP